jgi:hypothetical protein
MGIVGSCWCHDGLVSVLMLVLVSVLVLVLVWLYR